MMRLLTRGATLALMLLLGQFLLVGSGYACFRGPQRDAGTLEQSMSVRAAPEEHTDCADAPTESHSMLGGFTCTALGACGVAPMASITTPGATIVGLTHERVVGPPGVALTRSIAPELPPPRA